MKAKWKEIKDLAGFTHCVPATTPDNYFEIADREYKARWKVIAEAGATIHARLEHDKRWPLGPEAHGDTYLVEELGYKL